MVSQDNIQSGMSKISIIIPVYNTGKYLHRCIGSILNQTYKDLEVIVVDDGSKAQTAQICDQLAESDSRVKVYHKHNEGVSVARNFGLSKATGEYIGFVDSDDWIDSKMYERMVSHMIKESADVVYCDALTVWDDIKKELDTFSIPSSEKINRSDISPSVLFEIAGSVCRGLYKSQILKDIIFPVGLKFSEDRYFNLQVLSAVNSISYLKAPLYYRYMREDSCVNSFHPDAVEVASKGFDLMAEYADRYWGRDYYDEYRRKQIASYTGLLYSALHCNKGLIGTYKEVRKIASNPELHTYIEHYGTSDKRLQLAKAKCYFILFILIYIHALIKHY